MVLAALLAGLTPAWAGTIAVVAAENFYGDVARQMGGPDIAVTSILSNPEQDPHLFEASPSVARAIAGARVVIYNGVGYDPWMEKLLRTDASSERDVIEVAALVGRKAGDNPHLWYDPTTIPALAKALAAQFANVDPADRANFDRRLERFRKSFEPIEAKIGVLRRRLAGSKVTATEPVFGYLLAALGMEVTNQRFQLAVMNNTEPSASDIAALENDLRYRRVRLLVYNSQVSDPLTRRMLQIAQASHVPVIGATETEPPGTSYQAWITNVLGAIDLALPN